jgi:hypothetical protein
MYTDLSDFNLNNEAENLIAIKDFYESEYYYSEVLEFLIEARKLSEDRELSKWEKKFINQIIRQCGAVGLNLECQY